MEYESAVFLTNFIPPYKESFYKSLSTYFSIFTVVVNTEMEKNREWVVKQHNFEVFITPSITIKMKQRGIGLSAEYTYVHIPIKLLPWLFRARPRIVYAGELGLRTFIAAIYKIFSGPDMRLIVHADLSDVTEYGRGYLRYFLRLFIFRAANIIIVNGASGKRYVKRFGIRDIKIVPIPYATDPKMVSTSKNMHKIDSCIYVGELSYRKGILMFLETLIEWCEINFDRNIHFTIVGKGELETHLHKLVELSPKNLTIDILGFVPYADLPNLYASHEIFVFPSFSDTWALVVNEAMANGLPVLGSVRAQACDELVQEGATGWRFDPKVSGENGMMSALDRCFLTPSAERHRMGQHARQVSLELLPETIARRFFDATVQ